MVPREWVKRTELSPTIAQRLRCVTIEATNICSHHRYLEQTVAQYLSNTRFQIMP